ncbi:MAG TPA: GGDEF domain-containing protein [Patescibacteria group bacterium]|nr:GGDEF domain-containing protein [Patescibacteria group bacterium]
MDENAENPIDVHDTLERRESPVIKPLYDLRSPVITPKFILGSLDLDIKNASDQYKPKLTLRKNYYTRLFETEFRSLQTEKIENPKEVEKQFIKKTKELLDQKMGMAVTREEVDRAQANSEYFDGMISDAREGRDPLTGLYNRYGFVEMMTQIMRDPVKMYGEQGAKHLMDKKVAVIITDIDDFGLFNKKHGMEVGDAVLETTALAMREGVRPSDVVCRHGGEENVVVAFDVDPKLIYKRMNEKLNNFGNTFGITFSAGAVEVEWEELKKIFTAEGAWEDKAKQFDNLILKQADNELRIVKSRGKNNIKVAGTD